MTTSHRFWNGFENGLVGTIAMSIIMLVIYALHASAMPEPVPLALVVGLVGRVFHLQEITMLPLLFAIALHIAYGGFWMGLLEISTDQVTWWKGLVIGVGLWLVMAVFFVPLAGQSVFLVATKWSMWFSTLVMHAVYGATAGAFAEYRTAHRLRRVERTYRATH